MSESQMSSRTTDLSRRGINRLLDSGVYTRELLGDLEKGPVQVRALVPHRGDSLLPGLKYGLQNGDTGKPSPSLSDTFMAGFKGPLALIRTPAQVIRSLGSLSPGGTSVQQSADTAGPARSPLPGGSSGSQRREGHTETPGWGSSIRRLNTEHFPPSLCIEFRRHVNPPNSRLASRNERFGK